MNETTLQKLIGTKELAKILGVSTRSVARLECSGRLPKPLRVGGLLRWPEATIARWIDSGCPSRANFERACR